MKNIILLGSTGSVGKNVLNIVRAYPDKFRVKALSTGKNVRVLAEQVNEFSPDIACVGADELYSQLKENVKTDVEITSGPEELVRLAGDEPSDIVFMAISGRAALKPLMAALEAGKRVALASKEPIVSAGEIIKKLTEESSAQILPVDSEHSAIMQCLAGRNHKEVDKLYITGSGGTLKDRGLDEFDTLSVDEILAHPKWDMGRKITVDSATLMNKGLEVIEAHWLFDVPADKIKVVIHPEAIIHSMVEFVDGTISASMFSPDMRFPILRALSYPDILASDLPRVDFTKTGNLSFSEPDRSRFPALDLAFRALKEGGTLPAALNSSNEAAVNLFLEGKIKFTDIVKIVEAAVEKHKSIMNPTLEEILESEKWAEEEVFRFC
ncbi:1-deoxy-D-xylulose-5-phosphate reductoisomerase [Candidatus Omnitrophota bacterium]